MKAWTYRFVHIIAGGIFFVGLTYSIYIAGQLSALDDGFGFRSVFDLYVLSPGIYVVLIVALPFLLKNNFLKERSVLIALNVTSLFLAGLLFVKTLQESNGLWIEWTFHDRHFCNCVIRHHLFPPYVGGFGIAISFFSYFSFRALMARRGVSWACAGKYLTVCLPMLGFIAIMYAHQFIAKPVFIG